MIPFLDLRSAYLELKEEIDSAILRVASSGHYILGEEVEAFESEWATYCEADYSVGVANGLDALILSLKAVGVESGDEVIVPSNTFIATWLAITAVGAVPIPVEPKANSFNIDIERIESAITTRTKVIMPVHLFGEPADIDPILDIAEPRGIRVVEDAAQAHAATYKNRRIGSHGHLVCWSFYPGKNLGALGDAGAITTNNRFYAEKLRALRNYGSSVKYVNDILGQNSRLDPIQAAVLRVKLRYLDVWTERRRQIAQAYLQRITAPEIQLPVPTKGRNPAWHLFVIRTPERNVLQAALTARNVQTLIHYPIPPHMQKAYEYLGFKPGDFPVAKMQSEQVLSLPMGPHLSVDNCEYVATAINEACRT